MGLIKMEGVDINVFKDVVGRWRTTSLFIEFNKDEDKYPAFYTLGEEDATKDGKVYISAKRKYMHYADPTEYLFATKIFGSYECWEAVLNSPDIRAHVEQWRKELDLKLRSEAICHLRERMGNDINAEKWFAEEKWKAPKRGRPRKQKVTMPFEDEHKAAAERLGIKAVK
jgi:hypothetical protein